MSFIKASRNEKVARAFLFPEIMICRLWGSVKFPGSITAFPRNVRSETGRRIREG